MLRDPYEPTSTKPHVRELRFAFRFVQDLSGRPLKLCERRSSGAPTRPTTERRAHTKRNSRIAEQCTGGVHEHITFALRV